MTCDLDDLRFHVIFSQWYQINLSRAFRQMLPVARAKHLTKATFDDPSKSSSWTTNLNSTNNDMSTQSLNNGDQPPPTIFPDPLIIEPRHDHKSALIVLHGYGDTAFQFALGRQGFLMLKLPDGRVIAEHLPNTRFVFPQAPTRYSKRFKMDIPAWFDIYSWDSDDHQDWQVDGLSETTEYIHGLIGKESEIVGSKNVFLAGLSMGCAAACIGALVHIGREPTVKLGGIIGMSGWLPLRHDMLNSIEVIEPANETTAFATGIVTLSKTLGLECAVHSEISVTPWLILHGTIDEKVDVKHGAEIVECLREMDLDVTYKEYSELEHWMSGEELDDIVKFIVTHRNETRGVSVQPARHGKPLKDFMSLFRRGSAGK